MKIAVGSVVKGFKLKEAVKAHLQSRGHTVTDVGCPDTAQFCKFPSVGQRIAHALGSGAAELAINCCGSGTGAAISAGIFLPIALRNLSASSHEYPAIFIAVKSTSSW